MDEKELMKCIQRLSETWKAHFGLHTYYVGYLTAELLISLLYVWRTSDPIEFDGLDGKEIRALLDEKTILLNEQQNLKLALFPFDSDIDTVMPKLIDELNHYDLSESNLSEEKWKELIDYLSTKKNR